MSVCLTVTSRYCTRTSEQIKLVFGIEAALHFYFVLGGNLDIRIRAFLSETPLTGAGVVMGCDLFVILVLYKMFVRVFT